MSEELQMRGLTMATVKAGLAAGTTNSYSTVGTTQYCISGKAYSKSAVTNGATPTNDVNTGKAFIGIESNKGSVFVFGYNAAGTLKVAQGSMEDLDTEGNFIVAPSMPAIPDDFCPFAYMLIQADSTASTWTFGVSNQAGATGITYTRQDVMTLPQIPQTS